MGAMDIVILVFVTILIGSCMQRVSGMGVGLLGAPVLSIVMGPVDGVMVINALAAVNAALSTLSVRKDVDWRKFALIGPVMVVGAVPAAWLIHSMSLPGLQLVVGVLLVIALLITTVGLKFVPLATGPAPAVVTGAVSGFTNTLSGVAGPVITVYAQAARWDQRSFVATLQPLFVVSGVVSFLIKFLTDAGDISGQPWGIWPGGLLAMVIGITIGARLSGRVDRDKARKLSLAVAGAGAAAVLVHGGAGLV